jgi:nicotinamidase-related amidase
MEALDPGRTAALIVDMQWPYFQDGSPLILDGAADLVARTAAFTDDLRAAGVKILYTATLIRPGTPVGRTTKGFPFKEQNRDTWSNLAPGIEPATDDVVIHKPRHSAFFGTDLDTVLRSMGVQNVVVTGVTSNVCCYATALDAAARDYTVYWVHDLIAALPISRPGFEIDAETAHHNTSAMVAYSVGTVCTAAEALAALRCAEPELLVAGVGFEPT